MREQTDIGVAIAYVAIGLALFVAGTLLANAAVDADVNAMIEAMGGDPVVSSWQLTIGGFTQFVGQVTISVGVLVSASRYFRS